MGTAEREHIVEREEAATPKVQGPWYFHGTGSQPHISYSYEFLDACASLEGRVVFELAQ
jgi:hypothetical protein